MTVAISPVFQDTRNTLGAISVMLPPASVSTGAVMLRVVATPFTATKSGRCRSNVTRSAPSETAVSVMIEIARPFEIGSSRSWMPKLSAVIRDWASQNSPTAWKS